MLVSVITPVYNTEKYLDECIGSILSQSMTDFELLLIDDLGTELVTRYTQAEVYDLVNHRLNTGKPTIINTNLGLQEIERTYSSRVHSRLAGMYAAVQFKGRDIRLQKKQEGYR